jgi:hypothetical protein
MNPLVDKVVVNIDVPSLDSGIEFFNDPEATFDDYLAPLIE